MQLRDGTTTEDPRLDRLEEFDVESRNYPVTAKLETQQQSPVTKLWTIPDGEPVLNQGKEGACVGYGVTNEMRFNPVPVPGLTSVFAKQSVYWPAQRNDQWPGGSYPGATPFYEGTSVLAGIKEGVKLGHYTEYRWAFGEADLALAVSYLGPAVVGLPWYSGMFKPDRAGFLNPTGTVQGGHCLLVIGLNVRFAYYTVYNSWGPTWGEQGTARIRRSVLDRLLHEKGEACVITGRAVPGQRSAAE